MEYYHLAELEATNKKMMVVVSVNVACVDDAILMTVRFHCRIVVWYVDDADEFDNDVRRPKNFLDSAVAVQLMLETTPNMSSTSFPFSFLTFLCQMSRFEST